MNTPQNSLQMEWRRRWELTNPTRILRPLAPALALSLSLPLPLVLVLPLLLVLLLSLPLPLSLPMPLPLPLPLLLPLPLIPPIEEALLSLCIAWLWLFWL
jgi:hypothetical protein